MKSQIKCALLCTALAALCLLPGCQKARTFQTAFPPNEAAIVETLKKAGLSGAISAAETTSQMENHISYTIREPKTAEDSAENGRFVASVSAAALPDGRALYTVFDQRVEENTAAWSDWKQQIVFATLLYGGFADENTVYQALCSGAAPPASDTAYQWKADLPEGYCVVSYHPRSHKTYDANGFEVQNRAAFLRVNIFESDALYQQLQPKQQSQTDSASS